MGPIRYIIDLYQAEIKASEKPLLSKMLPISISGSIQHPTMSVVGYQGH